MCVVMALNLRHLAIAAGLGMAVRTVMNANPTLWHDAKTGSSTRLTPDTAGAVTAVVAMYALTSGKAEGIDGGGDWDRCSVGTDYEKGLAHCPGYAEQGWSCVIQ